jgi:hypothetical protein
MDNGTELLCDKSTCFKALSFRNIVVPVTLIDVSIDLCVGPFKEGLVTPVEARSKGSYGEVDDRDEKYVHGKSAPLHEKDIPLDFYRKDIASSVFQSEHGLKDGQIPPSYSRIMHEVYDRIKSVPFSYVNPANTIPRHQEFADCSCSC